MNNFRLPIPLLLGFPPATASVERVPMIHIETGIHTFLGYLLLVVAVATASHAGSRHFWRICGFVALVCALIRVVSYYFSMPVLRHDLALVFGPIDLLRDTLIAFPFAILAGVPFTLVRRTKEGKSMRFKRPRAAWWKTGPGLMILGPVLGVAVGFGSGMVLDWMENVREYTYMMFTLPLFCFLGLCVFCAGLVSTIVSSIKNKNVGKHGIAPTEKHVP